MNYMLKRLLLFVVFAVALFAFVAWMSWSPGPAVYATPSATALKLPSRFRTWDEHDAIIKRTWPKPYILEMKNVVMYGAHHTSDRNDPQLADIERRWRAFKPTVALNEGRRRGNFLGPFTLLGSKSESQLVHALAVRDHVRFYSLEPRYEDEVAALLRKWTPEQVALFFTTRVYWSEANGKANDRLAADLLRKRTDVDGLRGSLRSVGDIDRVWNRDFAGEPDWRTRTAEPETGYLGEIADESRRIRGEHMARTIIDLANRGERVFAVVGSGHVIRLELILRAAIERERTHGARLTAR